MADPTKRFVKVYREILTDPRFRPLRADRAALGTWVLFLLDADMAWPDPVSLPRWADQDHIDLLVGQGVITLPDPDHYLIHGLDAERERQSEKASHAARVRWAQENDATSIALSNAGGNAQTMPTQTQTQTKTQRDITVLSSLDTRASSRGSAAKRTGFTRPFER